MTHAGAPLAPGNVGLAGVLGLHSVPSEKTPLPKIFLLGDRNEANA